ncbi:hypothetical protein LJK87_04425 [Paenibacillus sp. P25]|nr:hypothetical protein LJK87_04425 [Paenibacillus sp. P25]
MLFRRRVPFTRPPNPGDRSSDRSTESRRRYDEKWDGQWHIVMLEVPEEERRKRDQFRSLMLELGFGPLYHSVYISPWDTLEDVLECVRALGLEGNCTYVQGEIRHGVILPEKARNVWRPGEGRGIVSREARLV